jgi:hypothetical protein
MHIAGRRCERASTHTVSPHIAIFFLVCGALSAIIRRRLRWNLRRRSCWPRSRVIGRTGRWNLRRRSCWPRSRELGRVRSRELGRGRSRVIGRVRTRERSREVGRCACGNRSRELGRGRSRELGRGRSRVIGRVRTRVRSRVRSRVPGRLSRGTSRFGKIVKNNIEIAVLCRDIRLTRRHVVRECHQVLDRITTGGKGADPHRDDAIRVTFELGEPCVSVRRRRRTLSRTPGYPIGKNHHHGTDRTASRAVAFRGSRTRIARTNHIVVHVIQRLRRACPPAVCSFHVRN